MLFGPAVYPYEDAPDVLMHYREFAHDAPRECCVWVDSVAAPPLPFLPEDVHGTLVLLVVQFYAGDPEEGENVLEPLCEYGDPIADAVAPTNYTEAQSRLDDLYGEGERNYWKAHNFTELTDEAIDTIVEYSEQAPTPQSEVLIRQVGGAVNDVPSDATAYPHRETEFIVTVGAHWEAPSKDDECIEWVREGFSVDLFADAVVSYPGPGYPYEPVERLSQLIASTSSLRGFDNIVYKSSNLETTCGAVLEGMTFEYVFTPEVLEGMFVWNPDRTMEVTSCENATVLVHNHLPDGDRCGLGIVDERAGICCHDVGTGTLVAVIDTDAPEARD